MPGLSNPYDPTQMGAPAAPGGALSATTQGGINAYGGGGAGNNPYGGYLTQALQQRQQQGSSAYADALTKLRALIASMPQQPAPQGALSTPTPPSQQQQEPPEDVAGLYNQGDYFKNLGSTEAATKDNPGGDYSIVNPASGAGGKYQFIEKTWADLMKQYPELALTLEGRTSSTPEGQAQQERAVRALTKENVAALKPVLGRAPTHAETYVAHLLGPGYGSSVLRSNETPIDALVPDSFVKANPFLKGITGKQLVQMFAKKFR